MTIDIAYIAKLARIAVTEEQLPAFSKDLTNILELASVINNVDTDDIEPMAHPLDDQVQRLRDDHVTAQDQRSELQAIAPKVSDGVYLVPTVIE